MQEKEMIRELLLLIDRALGETGTDSIHSSLEQGLKGLGIDSHKILEHELVGLIEGK